MGQTHRFMHVLALINAFQGDFTTSFSKFNVQINLNRFYFEHTLIAPITFLRS